MGLGLPSQASGQEATPKQPGPVSQTWVDQNVLDWLVADCHPQPIAQGPVCKQRQAEGQRMEVRDRTEQDPPEVCPCVTALLSLLRLEIGCQFHRAGWPGTHYVDKGGFEFLFFLLLPPKRYSNVVSHLASEDVSTACVFCRPTGRASRPALGRVTDHS